MKYIVILILSSLLFICYLGFINKLFEIRVKNDEIIKLKYSLNYKNKQIDSLQKIVNSDKIVVFNGKIIYW